MVGSGGDGDAAVAICAELGPDVALMDLSMPGVGGVEATRLISERVPGVQVIVLTSFMDRERVTEALDAGPIGYLLKDAEPGQLFYAIHAAARGESPLDPRAARAMLAAQRTPDRLDALTAREREVLALVAEGLADKQIARRLEISEKTVKAHLTSAFRTIGVDDRMQAGLWARRNGFSRSRLGHPAEGHVAAIRAGDAAPVCGAVDVDDVEGDVVVRAPLDMLVDGYLLFGDHCAQHEPVAAGQVDHVQAYVRMDHEHAVEHPRVELVEGDPVARG